MNRLLACGAGILVLATAVPVAWPQETAAPEAPAAAATAEAPAAAATSEAPVDPMAKALATIESPTAAMSDLTDARSYLVDQRQISRPQVVELLGDPNAQVRLNAAIVLAAMAAAGDTSPATLQGLQTALKDKELAVAYWGFQGLMSDGVPTADQKAAITAMMRTELPRALRLAALLTLDQKKPTLAVPIIVSHLQEILKEYRTQVETLVTSAETIKPATATPSVIAPVVIPGQPAGPARPGTPPGGAPPSGFQPGAGFQPGVGRGRAPAGRIPPALLMARARRGAREEEEMPVMPTAPLLPGAPRQIPTATQVRRADLQTMTLSQLQNLARGVEALPMVAEVHLMGMVLEDIVSNVSPDAALFDFKSTPPWDLDKCVDKAVVYLNSHQADYGAAGAPMPAVAPAAPPETAPAPAATPAAPAAARPETAPTPETTAPSPAGATPP